METSPDSESLPQPLTPDEQRQRLIELGQLATSSELDYQSPYFVRYN